MDFDIEKARFNMIEQQIRPWLVSNSAVLNALNTVKRELFIGSNPVSLAFMDIELPTQANQTMLAPKIEARLLQELKLTATDTVLEIGTGSGYMAALIGALANQVISIEIDAKLVNFAKHNLERAKIANVRIEQGDAIQTSSNLGKFDAICISASVPMIPKQLIDQLNIGGRLIAIVGDMPNMTVQRLTKQADNTVTTENLFETIAAPLIHAPQPERFKF